MSASFLLPVLVVAAAVLLAQAMAPMLQPRARARALVIVGIGAATTWLWLVVAVAMGGLAEQVALERWIGWCPRLSLVDGHVLAWQGILGAALLASSSFGLLKAVRAQLCLRRELPHIDGSGVLVVDSPAPGAFAVPGRRGGVVVTQGMIATLDADEQQVLWAHETAHLRNNHHRFLILSDLFVGVLPLLSPVRRQLDFAIERWADEDSAARTGDRRLVARAIAKAGLASMGGGETRLAMANSSVPARVEAMLSAPRSANPVTHLALGAVGALGALAIGGSTIQLHHLLALARHVCTGG